MNLQDAHYKNVAIENGIRPFPNQGTRGTARLWILRSKFNAILEMVADSDIHLPKLDAFWKDLLQKPVMNTNLGQYILNHHSLKQILVPVDPLWFYDMVKN